MAKPDTLPENGSLKPFPMDKEKLASVAKIKVVVCFLGLHFTYHFLRHMNFFIEIICESIEGSQKAPK